MTLLAAALTFTTLWGDAPPKWATDLAVGRADSMLFVASLDSLYHFEPQWTIGAAEQVERVIEFTLPTMQSAHGCAAGPDSLRDSLQWRVSVRVQSAAWIAMRPAMLADPSVWAAIWPIVRSEAEPQVVASGIGAPGSRVSASPSDTLTAPHWYSATSRNGRGESCTSNVVAK